MKVCGFDLFGALSKNTGQTTADKMKKSGGRGERERHKQKERGRRKCYQHRISISIRSAERAECGNSEQVISLSSVEDTQTGITEFRRMTKTQIK